MRERHPGTQRWEKCHVQGARRDLRERRRDRLHCHISVFQETLRENRAWCSRPLAWRCRYFRSPVGVIPLQVSESMEVPQEPKQEPVAGKEDPEVSSSLAWNPSFWKSGLLAFYSLSVDLLNTCHKPCVCWARCTCSGENRPFYKKQQANKKYDASW